MAEETMEDTNSITLKLLVDTKANKVLFAEASKDFVDFLFFLLSLPIGTVINLLASKSMAGSIGNLYNSFANLQQTYLQPNLQKDILLNPNPSISFSNFPLLTSTSDSGSSSAPGKVYSCSSQYCKRVAVTDKYNSCKCPGCGGNMTSEMKYIASPAGGSAPGDKKAPEGYVQKVVTYMISDDLMVTPMSMISSISIMNKFNVTNLNVLQEKEVQVGSEEGLELLNASFKSNTVLSDVFLGREEDKVVKVI